MSRSIEILRQKGHIITTEESEAAQIAALLHDVGHGPFSHVLEHSLVPIAHEQLTTMILHQLNNAFDQKLQTAIEIFEGSYPKKYLCHLVASQLDVDRMDYLNRDSFYSGVAEGTIGYHRLLTMMDIRDGHLVFEEKAGLSIENYLAARRLMYWQVYMHKTSLVAEQMLELLLSRCKETKNYEYASPDLEYFLRLDPASDLTKIEDELLLHFQNIDDSDIEMFLKQCRHSKDELIRYLSSGLLTRRFFKIQMKSEPFEKEYIFYSRRRLVELMNCSMDHAELMVQQSKMEFLGYDLHKNEIMIHTKLGQIKPSSEILKIDHFCSLEQKYYLSIPLELLN